MFIDLSASGVDWRDVYRLCIGFINPRPIALVSTVAPDGRRNLAPFSFYNMVSARPPVVMFSAGIHRDGRPKDTYRNVVATREFVIATATASFAQQMVDCSAELPYGQSEFEFAGLTPNPAQRVRPALVAESPVNIECVLREVLTISDQPGGAHAIFGEIVALHVADGLLRDAHTIDPQRLQTVGRLGGAYYTTVTDPYELHVRAEPSGG